MVIIGAEAFMQEASTFRRTSEAGKPASEHLPLG